MTPAARAERGVRLLDVGAGVATGGGQRNIVFRTFNRVYGRAEDRYKALPFIMITAESKPDNVIAAKQAGVNNYIVKPFNAQTLKQKLEAVFGAF